MRHTSVLKVLATLALVVGTWTATAGTANAAADPNGIWKWTFPTQNGDIELALTLKAEGEKLTGQMIRGDMKTDINDGMFKNDEVTFNVVRERDGQKFTAKYKGKVEADTIKGTIDIEFNGETRSLDWEAKRK